MPDQTYRARKAAMAAKAAPTPPGVRGCGPEDTLAIATLLRALSETARGEKVTAARVGQFLDHCRSNPGMYSNYLAEIDGEAVGFLSAVFYETPFHARGTCLINELVVGAARRGRGVGRALVEAVREEAAKRGFDEVEVGTERGNLSAQRFYRAVGFDEEYVLLGMEFEEGEKVEGT